MTIQQRSLVRPSDSCLNNNVPEGVNGLCYYASSINSPLFSRRWSLQQRQTMKENAGGVYFGSFFPIFPHPSPFWPPPDNAYIFIYLYIRHTCIIYVCVCMCVWGECIAVEVPSVVYCYRRRTCA